MTKRRATEAELDELREIAKSRRFGYIFDLAVSILTAIAFTMPIGAIINWVLKTLNFPHPSFGVTWLVLSVGFIACFIFDIQRVGNADARRAEEAIADGLVEENLFQIEEAIRFIEPTHDSFYYFLRTADGKVLFQIDYDSQGRGAAADADLDPWDSSYVPARTLTMVHSIATRYPLASGGFSGAPIENIPTYQYGREDIPEPDTFVRTKWENIVKRYGDSKNPGLIERPASNP